MIKYDKNENEKNNVLESEKNHFGTFAKNIFNLNIQYKTTNNSKYEYSDHIIDWVIHTKQIILKENILFMFHHIHGAIKFREYSVYVSSHTWGI
jgi:hypothetical protein